MTTKQHYDINEIKMDIRRITEAIDEVIRRLLEE